MNWKQTAIAAVAALSLIGVTAYAQGSFQPVHGYGMGQGMMGGYGGGYGMGPGMMGGYQFGAIERLDLNTDQRQQLGRIEGDLRKKNWALMDKMHDAMESLYDQSSTSDKADRAAILAANKKMSDLHQQMLENSLDATDKAVALLTPQQREQYQRLARAWGDGDRD